MERIHKSWCIVSEMLYDRGFVYPDNFHSKCISDAKECMCCDDFISWVGEDISEAKKELCVIFSKEVALKASSKIMTFWIHQFGITDLQRVYEQMAENDISHAIVIYNNKITSAASGAMKHLKVQGKIIEPFHESELQYNITKSKWVPRHIICSKNKKEEIMKTYNIKKEEIPFIKVTDPVVRYLGANRGQLIKIVRPSESIGSLNINESKKELFDISYRIVV